MVMMTVVVLRMMVTMMMLQPVPYHVHLYAGESSDSGGVRGMVRGWVGEGEGEGGEACLYNYVCMCVRVRQRPGLSVSMFAYEMRLSACKTQQPIQRRRGGGWGVGGECEGQRQH